MPFPMFPDKPVCGLEGRMHLPPDTESGFSLCINVIDFNRRQADCQWSKNEDQRHQHQLKASGAQVAIHQLRIVRAEVHGK